MYIFCNNLFKLSISGDHYSGSAGIRWTVAGAQESQDTQAGAVQGTRLSLEAEVEAGAWLSSL